MPYLLLSLGWQESEFLWDKMPGYIDIPPRDVEEGKHRGLEYTGGLSDPGL